MAKTRCLSLLFMIMLLAFTHSQALAGFYTGNDLVPLMQEYDRVNTHTGGAEQVKAREYGAYICGVYDTTESHVYGAPDQASRGQIIAVVSKYLKNHPEKWSEAAANLVVMALSEAFPLKKSK